MEPVWHVVKEIWDRADRCVASEVVSTYEEERTRFRGMGGGFVVRGLTRARCAD